MIHHRFPSCLLFIACGVDIAPINEGAYLASKTTIAAKVQLATKVFVSSELSANATSTGLSTAQRSAMTETKTTATTALTNVDAFCGDGTRRNT